MPKRRETHSQRPSSADSGIVIAKLQQQMLEDKHLLEQRLARGEITAEKFATEVNSVLNSVLKKASKVLTPKEFENAFGFEYSDQEVVLLDPKLAAASAKAK